MLRFFFFKINGFQPRILVNKIVASAILLLSQPTVHLHAHHLTGDTPELTTTLEATNDLLIIAGQGSTQTKVSVPLENKSQPSGDILNSNSDGIKWMRPAVGCRGFIW